MTNAQVKKPIRRPRLMLILGIIVIGVLGIALIWWLTSRNGPGISPDSIIYIDAAQSLLSGGGFTSNGIAITLYPPFYSAFLAAISIGQFDLLQTGRALNSLLFGVNIMLTALTTFIGTRRSLVAALLAAGLFLVSAPLFEIHSYIWSEPLFLTLTLGCVILLCLYFAQPKPIFLVPSGISLALAILTRYAGLAFVPAGIIAIFACQAVPLRTKIRDAVLWCTATLLPVGFWIIRNIVQSGSAADRSFGNHSMPIGEFVVRFLVTISEFVVPSSLPSLVRLTILALLAIILAFTLFQRFRSADQTKPLKNTDGSMWAVCILFSITYIIFVYLAISYLHYSTPVDMRILSPVLALMLITPFAIVQSGPDSVPLKKIVWYTFIIVGMLWTIAKTPEAVLSAIAIHDNGLWYASQKWRNSETMAFAKSSPESGPLYSNGADILTFETQKPSSFVPEKFSQYTRQRNPNFEAQLQAMCTDIIGNDGKLIYFDLVDWRWYLPTQEEVAGDCNLSVVQRFPDGKIYKGTLSKLGNAHRR